MIKKLKLLVIYLFFGQQLLFGMHDIEEQTGRLRFRNKKAATKYFMVYLKSERFNIYNIEDDDQNKERYSFSIKKYIIEKCETFLRYLCFGNK
jgi:nanoRNase/pAp phosphatase (c-di-AMP/oligoRNAs hydrolase)